MAECIGAGELIITVKEARKLLGAKYKNYSDSHIEALVREVELMAEVALGRVARVAK